MCLLWLGGSSPAEGDSSSVIVLRGVLESKKAFGSPGSAETRKNASKVVVFVLKLPKPAPAGGLALPDNAGDPPNGFQELQLVCDYAEFPECEAILKKSINHPIRVVGQTARPAEPAEQLPVIMHVRLITVLQ